MMYSGLPRHARRVIKSTLSSAWLASGVAGAFAVVSAAMDGATTYPTGMEILFGSMLMTGASIAAFGVIFNRYRWEWVSSWLAASAVAPYAVLAWANTIVDWSHATTAFLFTSLVMFYIQRGALCAAHASKLREVHK